MRWLDSKDSPAQWRCPMHMITRGDRRGTERKPKRGDRARVGSSSARPPGPRKDRSNEPKLPRQRDLHWIRIWGRAPCPARVLREPGRWATPGCVSPLSLQGCAESPQMDRRSEGLFSDDDASDGRFRGAAGGVLAYPFMKWPILRCPRIAGLGCPPRALRPLAPAQERSRTARPN